MALIREGIAAGTALPDRPLADEVRDVQASRRRLAETNARQGSDISIQDVLAAACTEHALRAERGGPPQPDSAEARSADTERAEAELHGTERWPTDRELPS